MKKIVVHNKKVAIPVAINGVGRPIIFLSGLSFTQPSWQPIISNLQHSYQAFTFDLRGHGETSAASEYTFDAFFDDVAVTLDEILAHHIQEKPLLVGYSLGGDLAIRYAADHTEKLAGLIIIDGANPLPAPFLSENVIDEFRSKLESPELAQMIEQAKGTPYQILLKPQDLLNLNLELDVYRKELLDLYKRVTCPITMLMSNTIAGTDGESAAGLNKLWHEGIKHLQAECPAVQVKWFDADHQLVTTKANEIAAVIDTIK